MSEATRDLGIIGAYKEDGLPVVVKFVDEMPDEATRQKFPVLTVFSWKYDGSGRDGMPPQNINEQMLALEHAIELLENEGLCRHAYSRTGNSLKELAYYISSNAQFMDPFNAALRDHPRYPIEITFYEDPEWTDFETFRKPFKR